MKVHFKSLLSILFLYLAVGCVNNNSNKTTQKDSDSIATTVIPPAPIPQEQVFGKQFKEDGVKEDEKATGLIANIRDEYQRIQKLVNDGTLRKEATSFECKNDPGSGTLVRYYEGEKLILIDFAVNSEHWWEKKRVYFKDEEAFFVFEQDGNWMFGGPTSKTEYANTIDKIKERRYYLNAGELIKQLNKAFEVKSWEEKVTGDKVPHTIVQLKPNSVYPNAAKISQMKKGIVGC